MRGITRGVLLFAGAAALWCAALGSPASASVAAAPGTKPGIAGWTEIGSYVQNTLVAGEGVATVVTPHGTIELYRGLQSVPADVKAQGWAHIGDPDSLRGYIFDAYQGPSNGKSKMFLVTTPSGRSVEYVHMLVHGELYNNSFATVSPDAQWMLAGEWGTMSHLQIYPTPLLNHIPPLTVGRSGWPGTSGSTTR